MKTNKIPIEFIPEIPEIPENPEIVPVADKPEPDPERGMYMCRSLGLMYGMKPKERSTDIRDGLEMNFEVKNDKKRKN